MLHIYLLFHSFCPQHLSSIIKSCEKCRGFAFIPIYPYNMHPLYPQSYVERCVRWHFIIYFALRFWTMAPYLVRINKIIISMMMLGLKTVTAKMTAIIRCKHHLSGNTSAPSRGRKDTFVNKPLPLPLPLSRQLARISDGVQRQWHFPPLSLFYYVVYVKFGVTL